MRSRIAFAGAVAVAAAVAVAVGAMSSSAGTASQGNTLAGAWQQTVIRPAPLPILRSLIVFTADGGAVEMSNEHPTSRSPMFSTWRRVEGRAYVATGIHFRFNPQTGEFVGTNRITRTIELSQDGESYTTTARVTVLDPSGNVLGTGTAVAHAERMEIEAADLQP